MDIGRFHASVAELLVLIDLEMAGTPGPGGCEVDGGCAGLKVVAARLGPMDATELDTGILAVR